MNNTLLIIGIIISVLNILLLIFKNTPICQYLVFETEEYNNYKTLFWIMWILMNIPVFNMVLILFMYIIKLLLTNDHK